MNTLVSYVIVVAVVLVAGGAADRQVLTRVGSKTFYTIEGNDAVTWDEAAAACAKEGLKTAVVESDKESAALSAASLERAKRDKQHLMWLGAILKNGKWIWAATGDEVDVDNFDPDAELNDPGNSPTTGYNCGYISTGRKW